MNSEITVIEFYSGIGGLHSALDRSSFPCKVVAAYDWDPSACQVYEENFGKIVCRTDILKLGAGDLAQHNARMWLLSPSCQPYTVLNPNAKGADDPRAASFLHLVRTVIPDLKKRYPQSLPRWILVENVAGFEASTTRTTMLESLRNVGYTNEEFLLSPLQFGIPNSRLRYYLLATLDLRSMSPSTIKRHIPVANTALEYSTQTEETEAQPISAYLDPPDAPRDVMEIPPQMLRKWGRLFDIVKPNDTRTCCFTRSYTKMVEGTGSILQECSELDTATTFDRFNSALSDGSHPDPLTILQPLKLRYFTPTELLRIFHFIPPGSDHVFHWPDSISLKTKYKLIGNSVNVEVVRRLISYLIQSTPP